MSDVQTRLLYWSVTGRQIPSDHAATNRSDTNKGDTNKGGTNKGGTNKGDRASHIPDLIVHFENK
jgi:hypothetical protein